MRDPNCAKSEMKCYLEVNQMMIKNGFQDGGTFSNQVMNLLVND